MSEKTCYSSWLNGAGTLLSGIAACAAVYFAKEPLTKFVNNMNQTQVQTVVINTCEAKQQVDALIEKSNDPDSFSKQFNDIPAELPRNTATPTGLFIAPEFRDAAKLQVEAAKTPELKREILKNYWEKSLFKETKSNLNLNLNNDPKNRP